MRSRIIRVMVYLLVPFYAKAELVVIYDSGNTRPIAEFVGPIYKSAPIDTLNEKIGSLLGAADPSTLVPIRSPGLTPGAIKSREHKQAFPQAFFLIGADERSLQWLANHRSYLIEEGAVGLLVQADSVQDLETVAGIANGLAITPASGTDIAEALGISHYPFAITGGRLWQ